MHSTYFPLNLYEGLKVMKPCFCSILFIFIISGDEKHKLLACMIKR